MEKLVEFLHCLLFVFLFDDIITTSLKGAWIWDSMVCFYLNERELKKKVHEPGMYLDLTFKPELS